MVVDQAQSGRRNVIVEHTRTLQSLARQTVIDVRGQERMRGNIGVCPENDEQRGGADGGREVR